MDTLATLRKLNGDTYELVKEELVNAEDNAAKLSEYASKIDELNTQISTFNTEIESLKGKGEEDAAAMSELEAKYSKLSEDYEALVEYKASIELAQKTAVIAEYEQKLSDEVLNAYREKVADYTAEELDMHLAYELKKSNPNIFSLKEEETPVVPKETSKSGIERILDRYKK